MSHSFVAILLILAVSLTACAPSEDEYFQVERGKLVNKLDQWQIEHASSVPTKDKEIIGRLRDCFASAPDPDALTRCQKAAENAAGMQ